MERFSIEAVVFGRNDDYEPNWAEKLFASFAHNRRLFEGTRAEFRIAFVEWNPPPGRPLLAPSLVERFPFVRVIVVEPEVHQALCESAELSVMTNFPFNVGLRSSTADFTMITCGDEFYGSTIARRIIEDGLRSGCLYRAERVNVREDLDFTSATLAELEDPANRVSVDTCSEPPYDRPPYTNASGDFMLLDAGTMAGIRGMDEGIRNARLHTDSRLATTAMIAGAECELLGQTFHINHRQTYRNNTTSYYGSLYKWDVGLPYANGPEWGLGQMEWQDCGERIQRVTLARGQPRLMPWTHPDSSACDRAARVADRLAQLHAALQPEQPRADAASARRSLDVDCIYAQADWGSNVEHQRDCVRVETTAAPWMFAAGLPFNEAISSDGWHWLLLDLAVPAGAVGISFRVGTEFVGERYAEIGPRHIQALPIPAGSDMLIVRNVASTGKSSVEVYGATVVSQEKPVAKAYA